MGSNDLYLRSKLTERMSESMHVLDHDPSMALYRLQEHINKTIGSLVDRKYQVQGINNSLQGACFDLDNAIQTLEQINATKGIFENVQQKLIKCLTLKDLIDSAGSQSSTPQKLIRKTK